MKLNLYVILLSFGLLSLALPSFGQGAVGTWGKISHDFKEIPQGLPVMVEFKFKNTGNAPLIISEVKTSCGCTTPFYTKTPIMPNQHGVVKAEYNAEEVGVFNKTITVITNDSRNASQKLTIKGTVIGD